MSNIKKTTGKVIGFLPMNLNSMPDIHKIMKFNRTNQQLAIMIKPFDSRFSVQAYFTYRMALALTKYLDHTHIRLKKDTLVTLNYYEGHNHDVISKITRIGSRTFNDIKDARNYAKKRGGSTALSVSSILSQRASASANETSSASRTVSHSSSRTESQPSSYSLNDSISPKINSSVTSQLSDVAQYKGLTSNSNAYVQTSKAYTSLMSVSDASINSGLNTTYKKENWSNFMTSLTTYAGTNFKSDVNTKADIDGLSYALRYNHIPADFKHAVKPKKRRSQFSGDSIRLF